MSEAFVLNLIAAIEPTVKQIQAGFTRYHDLRQFLENMPANRTLTLAYAIDKDSSAAFHARSKKIFSANNKGIQAQCATISGGLLTVIKATPKQHSRLAWQMPAQLYPMITEQEREAVEISLDRVRVRLDRCRQVGLRL